MSAETSHGINMYELHSIAHPDDEYKMYETWGLNTQESHNVSVIFGQMIESGRVKVLPEPELENSIQ